MYYIMNKNEVIAELAYTKKLIWYGCSLVCIGKPD